MRTPSWYGRCCGSCFGGSGSWHPFWGLWHLLFCQHWAFISCQLGCLLFDKLNLGAYISFCLLREQFFNFACKACFSSLSLAAKSRLTLETLEPARLLCPWNSPGKNTRVGCHFLLQGIVPAQELNPVLLQCRPILYQVSYEGSFSSTIS